jgi:hypothetical protein
LPNAALPNIGVEGAAMSRGSKAARFDGQCKGLRHADRIARLGNRGVEQHRVVAQLHRRGGLRRHAEARIDDQRDVGKVRAQGPQPVDIVQPSRRADRRAPRHQHAAAGFDQAIGHHQILGRVGKDLEAVVAQHAGRLDQAEDVGLQGVVVADHFELDPFGVEQLARHVGGGDRFLHRVATRRVRQHAQARLLDQRPEGLAGAAGTGFAADRHGHDLRAGHLDRLAQHRRRRIARRTQQQAGGEVNAVEGHLNLPASGPRPRPCRRRRASGRAA